MFILVQPKTRKRYVLWLKLCSISLAVHLVLLFFLFFIYHRDELHLTLTMAHHNGAPVIMVPRKSGGSSIARGGGITKKIGGTGASTILAKSNPKKEVIKKPAPAKASLIDKKAKQAEPKKQKKKSPTTKKEKHIEQPKKNLEKKEEPKKELPKEPEKNKSDEKKKDIEASKEASEGQLQEGSDLESIELPLSGTLSMYEFQMQQKCIALQQEISQHWQPPLGTADCVCKITASVDASGVVSALVMQQASGVLIYDVAARTALYEAELPRWLWGKTITITFQQA